MKNDSCVPCGTSGSMASINVGAARKQLSDLMKRYGSKGDVKVASVNTYQTKVRRLLDEFIRYNGAPDSEWWAWKAQVEKKSAQTSAAASSKAKKASRSEGARVEADAGANGSSGDGSGLITHCMVLPGGKRRAELRLPADLMLSDFKALERTFALILTLQRNQILITNSEDGELPDEKEKGESKSGPTT